MTNATVVKSLYQRIYDDIEGRILSGEWLPGQRVPSEKDLSEQYKCSRMTVNKALSQLHRMGYIERRRRAGSVVTRPHVQSAVLEIHGVQSEVQALGLPYGYALRSRVERPAHHDDVVLLGIGATSLVEIAAVHRAGSRPFCYEERLINLAAVPAAADEPFEETAPGPWLLSRVPWSQAEHEISAVAASDIIATALEIPVGTSCLVIERRTWNADHVVTFVRLTYVGASHSVIARFGPA